MKEQVYSEPVTEAKEQKKPKVCSYGLCVYLVVVYALTALSAVVYLLYRLFPPFADLMNGTFSALVRRALAYLTNPLPVSFAECLILLSPVLLFVLVYVGVRRFSDSWKRVGIYIVSLLSALAIVFQIFVYGFAAGYSATSVDKKLGLEREKISPSELYETALLLVEMINEQDDEIMFREDGFSLMPYTYAVMNDKLIAAYDTAQKSYHFIDNFYSEVKPVQISEVLSYMHIAGVYSFFTGEANINAAFPDYTIPYTAAHELAHQRGIAREDEANFVAFLVCLSSDDAYIRYSGLVNLYEYVIRALSSADADMSASVRSKLDSAVMKEQRAYAEFFKKYQHSTAGKVSSTINNNYLQSVGTVGTKSYGMVVDLAVAYFKLGENRPQ